MEHVVGRQGLGLLAQANLLSQLLFVPEQIFLIHWPVLCSVRERRHVNLVGLFRTLILSFFIYKVD